MPYGPQMREGALARAGVAPASGVAPARAALALPLLLPGLPLPRPARVAGPCATPVGGEAGPKTRDPSIGGPVNKDQAGPEKPLHQRVARPSALGPRHSAI